MRVLSAGFVILMVMQADINGPQRKVLVATVRPAKTAHGASGIALRRGRTLPFVIYRQWSAPAGYYPLFTDLPKAKSLEDYERLAPWAAFWGARSTSRSSRQPRRPPDRLPATTGG